MWSGTGIPGFATGKSATHSTPLLFLCQCEKCNKKKTVKNILQSSSTCINEEAVTACFLNAVVSPLGCSQPWCREMSPSHGPGCFTYQRCPCALGLIDHLAPGLLTWGEIPRTWVVANAPEVLGTCKPQFQIRFAGYCLRVLYVTNLTWAFVGGRQRHDHTLKHVLLGGLFAQFTARTSKKMEISKIKEAFQSWNRKSFLLRCSSDC